MGIEKGDCGGEIIITAILESMTDGTVYNITVDEDAFFSAGGVYVN